MIIKVVVIILLLSYLANTNEAFGQNNINKAKMPKIIWAYWDNTDLPDIVKLCQLNWRKFAPNYKINLIHKKDVTNWVDMPKGWEKLPKYRQSDVLRLKLIEKYGGLWLDASTFLLANPDMFISKNDITLFTKPGSTLAKPIYENWFIAAPAHHPVIKKWVADVVIAVKNEKAYAMRSPPVNRESLSLPYFICHLALRNIYAANKKLFVNGTYYNSETTAFYEFSKHTNDTNYYSDVVKKNVFKSFKLDPGRLLIKLSKTHRKFITPEKIPKILY